jgi:hypothetical protein
MDVLGYLVLVAAGLGAAAFVYRPFVRSLDIMLTSTA